MITRAVISVSYAGLSLGGSCEFQDNWVTIELFNVDGSARPKRSPETVIFTSGKSSKCNGRHHVFGSVSSSEMRSTTSEVEFKS